MRQIASMNWAEKKNFSFVQIEVPFLPTLNFSFQKYRSYVVVVREGFQKMLLACLRRRTLIIGSKWTFLGCSDR